MRMITHPVPARVGDVVLGCRLEWRPADPLAVFLLTPVTRRDIEWTFARDLLTTGLHSGEFQPAGVGDVRIWRGDDWTLCVELRSPNGEIVLCLDQLRVQAFCAEVLLECPPARLDRILADAVDGWLAKQVRA